MKHVFFTLFIAITLSSPGHTQTVEELNAIIQQQRLHWTAGQTSRSLSGAQPAPDWLETIPESDRNGVPGDIWEPPNGLSFKELPLAYDLRDFQVISPVKDQGDCDSCWAFTAVAHLESLLLGSGRGFLRLSEQAVLDFSGGTCDGWHLDTTYEFLRIYGTCLEAKRQYTGVKTPFTPCVAAARIQSWYWLNPAGIVNDEYDNRFKAYMLLTQQPVASYIDLYRSFYSYIGGIYEHLAGEPVIKGHFVLIIGWGQAEGISYWICKNSWGTDWGQAGFFYIKQQNARIGTYTIGARLE